MARMEGIPTRLLRDTVLELLLTVDLVLLPAGDKSVCAARVIRDALCKLTLPRLRIPCGLLKYKDMLAKR